MARLVDPIARRKLAQARYDSNMKTIGFMQKRHWWPTWLHDWIDDTAQRARDAHEAETAFVPPKAPTHGPE